MIEPFETLKIKDWALEDRPREKLLAKGCNSLSDAELLAIFIRIGGKNRSAVELARKALNSVGNDLNKLAKASIKDLTSIKGIGEAKAVAIVASLELGRRRKLADTSNKDRILSSSNIFDYFHPIMRDLNFEEFWLLTLDRSNRINHKQKISQGGLSSTIMDIRIILRIALENHSSSIILCHNHPSGNNRPSNADIHVTSKLKEAASIMDITVLDHIIIAEDTYYSFADENIL